jgi:hypothetical protein
VGHSEAYHFPMFLIIPWEVTLMLKVGLLGTLVLLVAGLFGGKGEGTTWS